MEGDREYYKQEIIKMVNEIRSIDFLIYIYSFIKPMLKKDKRAC